MRIDSNEAASFQTHEKVQTKVIAPKKIDQAKVEKIVPQKIEMTDQDHQTSVSVKQEDKEAEVIKAIEKANSHIRTYDRRMEFSIHDETKQIMVKVIDTEDDSIIREIPSEKVLDMVARMWELAGIMVDEKI